MVRDYRKAKSHVVPVSMTGTILQKVLDEVRLNAFRDLALGTACTRSLPIAQQPSVSCPAHHTRLLAANRCLPAPDPARCPVNCRCTASLRNSASTCFARSVPLFLPVPAVAPLCPGACILDSLTSLIILVWMDGHSTAPRTQLDNPRAFLEDQQRIIGYLIELDCQQDPAWYYIRKQKVGCVSVVLPVLAIPRSPLCSSLDTLQCQFIFSI